jgi:hypothetical protein
MSGGWSAFVWWLKKNKAALEIITTPARRGCVAKIQRQPSRNGHEDEFVAAM